MIWIGLDFWPGTDAVFMFVGSLAAICVAHVMLVQGLRRVEPWKQGRPIDDNLVWFTLHALANAAIVGYAWGDTLHLLAHPLDAFGASEGRTQGIVMAIHLYHVLGFKLSMDDKIHHAVSVGVVGSMGYMFRLGRVQNAMNFFVCGLPGGIDYLLLAAAKSNLIPKITEKRINLWLQVAIRWPGMLLCINHAIVSKLSHGDAVSVGWIPILMMSCLHGWNGLYYAQRVCGNTYVTEHILKEERAAPPKSDDTTAKKEKNSKPRSAAG